MIFDVDGTLVQTNQVDGDCFVRAFASEFGLKSINTNWAHYRWPTDSGITRQLFEENVGRRPSEDELLRLQRHFVILLTESFASNPRLFQEVPGAAQLLQQLRSSTNWGAALATGGWRVSAILKLQNAGIDSSVLPAAFADDSLSREGILQISLARACEFYRQESFRRIVYVGDALWDLEAARRLSIPFVEIRNDQPVTALGLGPEGATHILHDFTNRDQFMEALERALVPGTIV